MSNFKVNHVVQDQVKKIKFRRLASCQECGKEMCISNMARHRRVNHGILTTKLNNTSGDVKEDPEINDEHEEDGNVYKKCEICFKAFKTIRTYRNHQMEVHNDSKPIFTCEMCYCDFSRKYRLMHHIDKVHKDELYWIDENKKAKFNYEDCKVSCQHCDKMFISEQSRKYHNLRNHGGV